MAAPAESHLQVSEIEALSLKETLDIDSRFDYRVRLPLAAISRYRRDLSDRSLALYACNRSCCHMSSKSHEFAGVDDPALCTIFDFVENVCQDRIGDERLVA